MKKKVISFDESLYDYQQILYIEELERLVKHLQFELKHTKSMGRITKK
jgi:hypothetical protein